MNRIFPKGPVEKVYNKRIRICQACPHIDPVGVNCVVGGTQPCCSVCGCSLALKLRSLESECPHPEGPKWKAEKA